MATLPWSTLASQTLSSVKNLYLSSLGLKRGLLILVPTQRQEKLICISSCQVLACQSDVNNLYLFLFCQFSFPRSLPIQLIITLEQNYSGLGKKIGMIIMLERRLRTFNYHNRECTVKILHTRIKIMTEIMPSVRDLQNSISCKKLCFFNRVY